MSARTHTGEVRTGANGTVLKDLADRVLGQKLLDLGAVNLLDGRRAFGSVGILVCLAWRRRSRVKAVPEVDDELSAAGEQRDGWSEQCRGLARASRA
jgi:hypothetical protein